MTDHFLSSTVVGGSNAGTSWTNAWNAGTQVDWTNAAAAITVAGDRLIVSDDNATVLGADTTFTAHANHTEDNPLQVIVASNDGGTAFTPVSDYGASGNGEISGNASWHFKPSGYVYFYGIRLTNFDSTDLVADDGLVTYERSLLQFNKVTAESYTFSNPGSSVILIDSDLDYSGASHAIKFNLDACTFRMIGGAITTDASVARLLNVNSGFSGKVLFSGVDMSGLNAATDIFQGSANESFHGRLPNCKFPATLPTIWGSALTNLGTASDIIVTQEAPYQLFAQYRYGNIREETTIRRSGGADTGAQTYSFKCEATSAAGRTAPLRHLLAIADPGSLASVTVKVHMASNTGVALKNDQVWIDISAPTSAGVFNGTSRNNLGATPAIYTDESGSEDWRNGGGALAGYQEQSMSVTPGLATTGPLYVWLCVAEDFATTNNLYVCPKLDIA